MVYDLKIKVEKREAVVCVLGLGYVGLPLAEAFSRYFPVIGFDINSKLIEKLKKTDSKIIFTDEPVDLRKADVISICVPTPVLSTKEPDLRYVQSAAEVVGKNIKSQATVVLESTVYPGVTEEILVPTIESQSGLRGGVDFKVGYSPERLSPGDDERTLQKVIKVISGMDEESADAIESLYGAITKVHRAESIKVAEAAKVIENTQRDLNIALFNELAIIFEKMGIDSHSVFEAAATKWNFHRYTPGLVGGHCIPVDPYYLVYKANSIGHHAQVILAGREVNDGMAAYVANRMIRELNRAGKSTRQSTILVMGVTYKENVPDVRSSPALGLIEELQDWGANVLVHDPCLDDETLRKLGFENTPLQKLQGVDGIIITVPHREFVTMDISLFLDITNGAPIIFDIKRAFPQQRLEEMGFKYHTL